jgi:hypothetical protein
VGTAGLLFCPNAFDLMEQKATQENDDEKKKRPGAQKQRMAHCNRRAAGSPVPARWARRSTSPLSATIMR